MQVRLLCPKEPQFEHLHVITFAGFLVLMGLASTGLIGSVQLRLLCPKRPQFEHLQWTGLEFLEVLQVRRLWPISPQLEQEWEEVWDMLCMRQD